MFLDYIFCKKISENYFLTSLTMLTDQAAILDWDCEFLWEKSWLICCIWCFMVQICGKGTVKQFAKMFVIGKIVWFWCKILKCKRNIMLNHLAPNQAHGFWNCATSSNFGHLDFKISTNSWFKKKNKWNFILICKNLNFYLIVCQEYFDSCHLWFLISSTCQIADRCGILTAVTNFRFIFCTFVKCFETGRLVFFKLFFLPCNAASLAKS